MLEKNYQFADAEGRIQGSWYSKSCHIYDWVEGKDRDENFVIDTPPPTVSGKLHIGHAFSYTQCDFIARFWRMYGKNVFYPIGFDDNGLPTERLIEKVHKVRAKDMSRAEFQDLCRKSIVGYEEEFEQLFKSLGVSFDWNFKYQTVSQRSISLSQMSFLDLYNKGYAIKKLSATFWDWVDQTAIAQAEIEDKTRDSVMNYIHFKIDGKNDHIEIATTRPELLAACGAVFYHPEDERYTYLDGESAVVPVYEHVVPLLPDVDVDMEKGSGLVMCCTYGDMQDVVWQERHDLPIVSCITKVGRMQNAGILDDMKVKAARAKMIEELRNSGILKDEKPISQTVKCAERSGEVIEILPTEQWYVDLLSKKKEIAKKINECNWHPHFMSKRAEIWNDNLNQNWCISRQRYFGVPIPVWYSKREGEEGKVLLPDLDQLPIDPSGSSSWL